MSEDQNSYNSDNNVNLNKNNQNSSQNQNNTSGFSSDEHTLAALAHILGILFGFLGPLVMYFVVEDKPFAKEHTKEALNFQLTLMIGYFIGGLTTVICIGALILPAVWIIGLIFSIQAAMAANNKQPYLYQYNIRFIK